jgi:hypothetical protein
MGGVNLTHRHVKTLVRDKVGTVGAGFCLRRRRLGCTCFKTLKASLVVPKCGVVL